MNKNWYAVYTKPQCEKKVAALLSKKKVENFCPLNRITNNDGNRRKMVYVPLFPSFVFVNISEEEMRIVRQTGEVINFVYWLGKPAVIKMTEIENISHFANAYYNIKLEKTVVNSNAMVRITREPLLDMEEEVISLKISTRVRLSLPALGFAMTAETERSAIDSPDHGFVNSNMLM